MPHVGCPVEIKARPCTIENMKICDFRRTPHRQRGFTLVELLVTLSVLAILAGLAAPSFIQLLEKRAVNAQVNAFADALRLARSEALKRGRAVRVCRIADPAAATPTCATNGGDWRNGWLVTEGTNLILVHQSLSNSGGVIGANNTLGVTYQPTGIATGGNTNFRFQSSSDTGPCRKVVIRLGRPSIRDNCS